MKLPKFFNYKEEGATDYGYEAIQDFFLGWTIRCSKDDYRTANPVIQEYARKLVFALIYGDNDNQIPLPNYILTKPFHNDFIVKDVKTYRQWSQIDLLAELEIEEYGKVTNYTISIENKWYTHLKANPDQLQDYVKSVESYYLSGERKSANWQIVKCVIFCDHEIMNEADWALCQKNNYKLLTVDGLGHLSDIYNNKGIDSGSDLFNAYWYDE